MATSTATILFTDVEGSTELRAGLGEAVADRVFLDHERRLTATVERHRGRVLKTAGDGIMAAFESASDAVAAAVDMQRAVSRSADDILMRVGIASGDVSWEDGDCFGLPVVTAARLEAVAAGGQIVVSHIVRWLAGDRSGATFEALGPVTLKGLPEPIEAFAVAWDPGPVDDTTEALPLPSALAAPSHFAFVGRQAEWRVLEAAWTAVRAGGRQTVLVGGEAGAGKTRLAVEFARSCHDAGATLLFGGCDPELVVPYQPWVQALDHLFRFLPPDELDDDVAEDLQVLAPLLPRLSRTGTRPSRARSDADAERYRLFNAVDAVLVRAAQLGPVVILIDDLQWAAPHTLALLAHLARACSAPLLLIATFRDTGDVASSPFTSTLADLRRVESVDRVSLRGLDADGVASFVEGAAGHELDEGLAQLATEISTRTLGNAFYVGELWHHVVATGVVVQRGNRWLACGSLADSGVPDSIIEVVTERLARLEFATRKLVELVAVAGPRVDLRVLRAAADMTDADIALALDDLVDAGLLAVVRRPLLAYEFPHALVRDTVEGGVPEAARARLHLRIGEALEAVHEGDPRSVIGELAAHYAAAAGLGAEAKAVYYLRRAGEQALASIAYDEALEHFTTALDLSPPGSDARIECLIAIGEIDNKVGSFDAAASMFELAFDLARGRGRAQLAGLAALGHGDSSHLPGLPSPTSVTMLTEAIEMLGDERSSLRAQLEASLALSYLHTGRADDAHRTSASAITIARATDDEALIWALGATVIIENDPHRRLEYAVELQQISERLNSYWYAVSGTTCELRSLVALGRLDEVPGVLRRHKSMAQRVGSVVADIEGFCFDATLALARGDFAAAEAAAERGLQRGTDRHPGAAGVYGLQMFAIRRDQGQLAEVMPVLELAARNPRVQGVWGPGLAVLFAEVGRLDDARDRFDALAADGFAAIPRDAVWPAALSFLADVCIALGDTTQAERLYHEMLPFANTALMVALTICLGPADRLLGGLAALRGRPDDAERHFAAAIELARSAGAPPWIARVEHDWARTRIARGEHDRAQPLVESALGTAEALGMRVLAEQCRLMYTKVPVAPTTLPDGLSAREVDVIRLIAAGCSNREIGERLSISANTAANHVRAILMKTATANRAEAAAYAARHALLDER